MTDAGPPLRILPALPRRSAELTEFHSDAITRVIRHSEAKAVFVSRRVSRKIADAPRRFPAPLSSRVSGFARIAKIAERAGPSEKTATKKIKRYLYADSRS
ncbi:MAG: hypothetical protein LBU06_03790 [Desulfovibrio sp.]|jgi:hypothetical protein|nr:hypothetical protein [Desulfovibrio sp.]